MNKFGSFYLLKRPKLLNSANFTAQNTKFSLSFPFHFSTDLAIFLYSMHEWLVLNFLELYRKEKFKNDIVSFRAQV